MQKEFLTVSYNGTNYVGYSYESLPLGAALIAAQDQVEQTADLSRSILVGNPLRMLEFQLAEREAKAFLAANFEGETPLSVKALAEAAEVSAQVATEAILTNVQALETVIHTIRTARLKSRHEIPKATSHAMAEVLADTAIDAIRASIVGVTID
ncbi:hypothetical protein [Pseudomonas sp. 2835]|uniref:hypothetical protein n=1 Tax=Pseudomonas sp. 2835 TaxID=3156451 RepID=UPI003D1FD6C7